MKLLILTQKVDIDDDYLGFFHNWINEFAEQSELVTVICLSAGKYDLPNNVKVLSLGKEKNFQFPISNFQLMKKLVFTVNFYKYIWRERNNYDKVFVHMNPEYVVLGGWLWKLWGKKIGLWYTHRQVNLKLKIAEKFADVIFTSSPESFRLVSKKVNFMGHGVDLDKFKVKSEKLKVKEGFNVVYVGRISAIKNQKLLVEAINILVNNNGIKNIKVDLIGGTLYEADEQYLKELKELVVNYKLENFINFVGSVPYQQIDKHCEQADLSINLCPTGGMDKAVLESMAAGVPAVVYNKTFLNIFSDYKNYLILENDNAAELAEKIKNMMELGEVRRLSLSNYLQQKSEHFSATNLISKILAKL